MTNEKIEQLQEKLAELERRHQLKEVTVKKWNEERRELAKCIAFAEKEMLDLRVEAWRAYRELGEQLDLF